MAMTSINLDQRSAEIMADLKGRLGASSKAEVMRRALRVLEAVNRAEQDGGELAVIDRENRVLLRVSVP